MKCLTSAQAVQRYGQIDLASGTWQRQDIWLKMFQVPPNVFKNWRVLDTQIPCSHFLLNLDAHTAMAKALDAVHRIGKQDLLKTFDGCFNIRLIRGSRSHISTHSYGLGIDLNANDNPLGAYHGGFYDHPDFVKCFTDQGWDWGGSWLHRKDPMHFSYAWE